MKDALGHIRPKSPVGNSLGATLFLFGLNVVIVVLESRELWVRSYCY
ncbi:MAG TPA: hypothetical protein VMW72_13360 [Sedimentisphaerales bacterium]|nr:hypothetical protein [Sedimentisphaerales bacterium]